MIFIAYAAANGNRYYLSYPRRTPAALTKKLGLNINPVILIHKRILCLSKPHCPLGMKSLEKKSPRDRTRVSKIGNTAISVKTS